MNNAGWKTIESAPEDGTIFLGKLKGDIIVKVKWVSHIGLARQCGFRILELVSGKFKKANSLFATRVGSLCIPTHWMPIPDGPEVK